MTPTPDINTLVRLDVEVWFALFGRIKTKEGKLVTAPTPNVIQRRLFAAYRRSRAARRPFKALGLKPRQVGLSTGTQAVTYHHNRSFENLNGALMADKSGTSDKVFEIYRTFAEGDTFDWGTGPLPKFGLPGNLTDAIILPNGSRYGKETAGSARAGAGGTIQVADGTEVAHFPKVENRDPALGFLNAFYDEGEMSLGLLDSTPNGPTGLFYDLWVDKNNGWEKLFAAWFEFPEHAQAFEHEDERRAFEETLDEDEREERLRYGVTLEQLKWRRKTIKDKCQGDPDKFRQEYPSNDIECFLRSSRLRFRAIVVDAMMKQAVSVKPRPGELAMQDNQRVSFRPDDMGTVELWEEPKIGCKYLVAADTCTGEDQQEGGPKADPDYHSIGVLRAGYHDVATQRWFPPRIVAHHWSRLESDLAALVAASMSIWYGRCIVIPEVNNCGLVMVKKLEEWGIPIYERHTLNRTAGTRDKFLGWKTDVITRKTIIDSLAIKIRDWKASEPTFELHCGWILEQYGKFVINKDGKAEAMTGAKDDGVLMSAIALHNESLATEYKLPKKKPIDLKKLNARQGWAAA